MAEVIDNKSIENLVKLLGAEVELYDNLLILVTKTQQALIKNNLADLNKALDIQQILIGQAVKLEEQRQSALEQLAPLLALPQEELVLSKLIEKVPQDCQLKLQVMQESLQNLVVKINTINGQNEELIKDSLEYIDYSMALMTDRGDDGKIYDQKLGAEKKKQGKSRIFDQRV